MMMNEREMSKRAARRAAKRRRVMRNRCILAGVIFALIAMTIGTIIVINNAKAADSQESQTEEVYVPQKHAGMEFVTFHHVVKGGESIGSIVANLIQKYHSDENVDDVVNRVFLNNGLDPQEATYHLQPGDKIYVPMWAHVEHEYEEELN